MKLNLLFSFALILCGVMSHAQINEDFENGLPTGWTAEGPWAFGDAASLASQYFNMPATTSFACINDDDLGNGVSGNGRMTSAPIDLTASTGVLVLEHDAFFINGDYQGLDETAKIFISKDAGATFTEVSDLAGVAGWQRAKTVISEYAGETILVAFEYADGDQWNYGYCIDNVSIGSIPDREVQMRGATISCTDAMTGLDLEITGEFSNEGAETITSIDVNWTDGVNTYTETITGLDVPTFSSYVFSHPTMYTAAEGTTNIEVSISNPNGMSDSEDDNMTAVSVRGVTPKAGHMIVVEEATGTWCPWCPRGAVFLDRYTKCFPDNFAGIAIHNADPMVNTEYDSWVGAYPNFQGYPSVIVDRIGDPIDPSDIGAPTVAKITTTPLVTVNAGADWDEATRTLTVGLGADFAQDMTNMKFNVVLAENGVTGTSTDYNQANNYAGGAFGPMGGYENLPASVPASMMVYDHVGRYLPGGAEGPADAVVDGVAGGEAKYIFDAVQIDAAFNVEEMEVIGFIMNSSGQIVNATKISLLDAVANGLETLTNTNDAFDNEFAQISPNPAQDITYLKMNIQDASQVSMTIVDAIGQVVATNNFGQLQGNVTLDIDVASLATGVYLVHLNIDNKLVTKKLSVQK